MTGRVAALFADSDFDAAVITSEVSRRYMSGFEMSDGIFVCSRDRAVLLADGRYFEAAAATGLDCEVQLLTDARRQLPELLGQMGAGHTALETRISVREAGRLSDMLKQYGASPDERLDSVIEQMRTVKGDAEVRLITAAQRIAEAAFEHVLGFIRAGVTELELAAELEYAMRRSGAEGISFETIAISGANTSKPHGVPSGKVIEMGDLVTMDFGAVYGGYHSDMTRTVAVGRVSDEQRHVYQTVLSAGDAALSVLCAGVRCADADAAAREIIESAGYGDRFNHSTGHGVGLEIHELPNLSPRSEAVLESGNIVTVEPGIYLPARFGVRVEDMALITADGCVNLTKADRQLIIL